MNTSKTFLFIGSILLSTPLMAEKTAEAAAQAHEEKVKAAVEAAKKQAEIAEKQAKMEAAAKAHAAAGINPHAAPTMTDEEAKTILSYAEGYRFAQQVRQSSEMIDEKEFLKGFNEFLEGKESQISQSKMMQAMAFMRTKMMKKQAEEAAKAKAASAELLKKVTIKGKTEIDALLKEELTTTASGLKYKVISAGEGEHPAASNTVTCHYQGWLTDGTKFDSSVDRGQPASFPLANVIKGWTEGLQLMKPGAKYIFVIPSDLAYGDKDNGPIPGKSTLVFEVDLLSYK